MPMLRAHVYVYGRVQGVFFRASTRDEAKAIGIKGWVKNRHNGSVEAVFEGEKDTVDKIVKWCKKGPAGAYVERVDVSWDKYLGEFDEFTIAY